MIPVRRTKILATLGPATDDPAVLDRLVAAGMDCARVNCSHGGPEDLLRRAAEVRAASERAGLHLGLLFDLQGPKLRLSSATQPRSLEAGEEITFTGAATDGADHVAVDFEGFARLCTDQSEIVIGDGVPRLTVAGVSEGTVRARVRSPGPLAPRKGVNVTYARPELPAITEKDLADLDVAVRAGADFVALSFVRSAADIEQLSRLLQERGSNARTIAKIEKIEAYENLDGILDVADGVMVARGDYGVEAGVARVPLMQKDTIARATQRGKLVITATQMLESMIQSPEPTRAEVADVANAVIDGTSAVMLSAETSVGRYPVEAVCTMAEIATAAEEAPEIHGRARGIVQDTPGRRDHARRRAARRRRRRGGDRRPQLDRRDRPRVREVPAQAPADRARPPGRRGGAALAGMGHLRHSHGPPGLRRRPDRRRPARGARLRRAQSRIARRHHRRPRRDARRHEPDHDQGGPGGLREKPPPRETPRLRRP